VPLNSVLQKRGQQLIGTGGAIAVQNLIDNAGMMILVGIYLSVTSAGLSARLSALAVGALLVMITAILQLQVRTARAAALSAGLAVE
jgi:hypothetical protein